MTDHLPGRFDGLPRRHPEPGTLELVELVLDGALPAEFLGSPRSLGLTDEATATLLDGGGLVLEDAEGTPVAAYLPHEDPALVALRPFTHGPLRRDRRTPAQVAVEVAAAAEPGVGTTMAVLLVGSIADSAFRSILRLAEERGAHILWLVVTGTARAGDLPPSGLRRAARKLDDWAKGMGASSGPVVPVAIPHQPDPEADRELLER